MAAELSWSLAIAAKEQGASGARAVRPLRGPGG